VKPEPAPPTAAMQRKLLSLLAGSLVGWAIVSAKWLLWPLLVAQFSDSESTALARAQLPAATFLFVVYGIPLAAFVSFLAGWPVLEIADRMRAHRVWHGMAFGAVTGVIIVVGFTTLEIVNGALAATGGGGSSYGGSEGPVAINGMPTALGWRLRAIELLYFGFAGSIAGIGVWKISKPVPRF
jgi:hypothetical protein